MSDDTPDAASRRHNRRFPLSGSVRLYSGAAMWNTHLLDLSLRGALVAKPEPWDGPASGGFRLDLRLENGPIIAMAVELVRVGENQLAFACRKIDFDSFTRLKRLIELNLGNPELLNRELAQMDNGNGNGH